MFSLAQYMSYAMGIGTVAAQILTVVAVVIFLKNRNSYSKSQFYRLFERYALPVAFLTAAIATLGSLVYSEIIGYEPCKLCWIQRIFLFPLSIIFLIALIRKDYGVWRYALPLSTLGLIVALNHYILQTSGVSLLPCQAGGISCSKIFTMTFGYITIPMMALSAFALITIFMLYARILNKSQGQ